MIFKQIDITEWYNNPHIIDQLSLNSVSDKKFKYKQLINVRYPDIIILYNKNKSMIRLTNKKHCNTAKNYFLKSKNIIKENISIINNIKTKLKIAFLNAKTSDDLSLIFILLRHYDFYYRNIYYESEARNKLNNPNYNQLKNKNEILDYTNSFLNKISKITKISRIKLKFLTISEIETYWQNKTYLDKQIIKRKKGFIYYMKGQKEYFSYNSKQINKIYVAVNRPLVKNQLKGLVTNKTNKNIVLGKTIVFKNTKFPFKLKLNDFKNKILCIPKLNLDIIPYLKNIKAIITEQGSNLSHASIVAREYNIPAVVNVKNITKIVKNGCLIEINLINGEINKK
jgi:phosphohistidine swiveling domain-containing protein